MHPRCKLWATFVANQAGAHMPKAKLCAYTCNNGAQISCANLGAQCGAYMFVMHQQAGTITHSSNKDPIEKKP